MVKRTSRRGFLKSGAITLGTLAVCDLEGLASGGQASGAKPVAPGDMKERAMPHVIVKMYPGRSEEQKRRLTDAIVKDVVAITQVGENSVSVAIEEISPAEWAEKVYNPDIQAKWDKLYKKPGY